MEPKAHSSLESWQLNAQEWINLMQANSLSSRKITNPAILNCILDYAPQNILDLGGGEGWLSRALAQEGIPSSLADGTLALIEEAKKLSKLPAYHLSFEEIIQRQELPGGDYAAVVLNFCLYQAELSQALLKLMHKVLKPGARLFIQTLHPASFVSASGLAYQKQDLKDVWKGLPGDFHSPHSWQFLTFGDWVKIFRQSAWQIEEVREPLSPDSKQPLSIIFVLQH